MMNILELESRPLAELRTMASRDFGVNNANRLKKETLAMMIREAEAQKEGIELRGDGPRASHEETHIRLLRLRRAQQRKGE